MAEEQSCPRVVAEAAVHLRSASECQLVPSGFGSTQRTAVEAELVGRPLHTAP